MKYITPVLSFLVARANHPGDATHVLLDVGGVNVAEGSHLGYSSKSSLENCKAIIAQFLLIILLVHYTEIIIANTAKAEGRFHTFAVTTIVDLGAMLALTDWSGL